MIWVPPVTILRIRGFGRSNRIVARLGDLVAPQHPPLSEGAENRGNHPDTMGLPWTAIYADQLGWFWGSTPRGNVLWKIPSLMIATLCHKRRSAERRAKKSGHVPDGFGAAVTGNADRLHIYMPTA